MKKSAIVTSKSSNSTKPINFANMRKRGIIPAAQQEPCITPYKVRDEKGNPVYGQGDYVIGRDT